jgi:hypothetical protein
MIYYLRRRNMSVEIVYVLSNPGMSGLLKIGMTDKEDIVLRMKELYTTGVPFPFDCVYACVVENNEKVESLMHEKFAKQRPNQGREFFKLKPERAIKALKPYEIEDVTPGFREEFDSPLTDAERDARRMARREAVKLDPTVAEAKDLHLKIGV